MDLTPLMHDHERDPLAHVLALQRRFEAEVSERVRRLGG